MYLVTFDDVLPDGARRIVAATDLVSVGWTKCPSREGWLFRSRTVFVGGAALPPAEQASTPHSSHPGERCMWPEVYAGRGTFDTAGRTLLG